MNGRVRRRLLVIRGLVLCGAVLSLCAPSRAESRKDVVVMKNGDHLTGEVKGLANGILQLKPDYVEQNIGLDWKEVQSVESTATYQVTLANGMRLTGLIRKGVAQNGAQEVVVTGPAGAESFSPADVAEVSTKKKDFWRQLKGNIDEGISYTSGNGQTTVITDASATYETEKWISSASLDTSFSGQNDASKTNRIDGSFFTARFLNRNSYIGNIDDFLHSSQQNLDLRATIGGGYGRYWIRTNNSALRWIGGLVYSKELFSSAAAQPSDSNVEGLLGFVYDEYRFRFGQIHLEAQVFPGISDSGRIRTTTNNTLNIKLANNFYFSVGIWDNFDSRPPLATAKKNELGVSSSLGWSF